MCESLPPDNDTEKTQPTSAQPTEQYIILGAGVIGLTTALTIKAQHPTAHVITTAQYFPGDAAPTYASPWAGANWLSTAADDTRHQEWEAATYRKLRELAGVPEAGVWSMPVRAAFDSEKENAGMFMKGTGELWFEELVGGVRELGSGELPGGARFGFEFESFVMDVGVYLPWLQSTALKAGIEFRRSIYKSLSEVFRNYPGATAVFNCTGIGSYFLGGVEDHALYTTLGQTLLVASPDPPLKHMVFRSPARTHAETTYIFPRGDHGGVILGGCRIDGVWEAEVDLEMAEDIKRRCCALMPELGKAEDLKMLKMGAGLRPSRKGGARIERELVEGRVVVHNYGAGGAGYQASWGMAEAAAKLLS